MDINKLQEKLLSKGIRVKDDDPVFVLVALNELVLEDMTQKYRQALTPRVACVANTTEAQASSARTTTTSLIVLTAAAISFSVGMFFGQKDAAELLVGSVGLALGVVCGAALCFAVYARNESQSNKSNGRAMLSKPNHDGIPWTVSEISEAATQLKLSNATMLACQEVLIHGLSNVEAADRYSIFPEQVFIGLGQLKDLRAKR